MEPARKLPHDVEPDIRPKLGVIDGGGETTPDRPGRETMRALDASDVGAAEAGAAKGAPKPDFVDNVTPSGGSGDNPGGKGRFKGWFKKAGPVAGIGSLFGIGGFVLIGLTSPSLLIVQLKETMVGKFNTQLASMEVRSNKLLVSKISGATSGTCGSVLTIRCKFTTMSAKQVDRMKAAGIEVQGKEVVGGRVKPTGLVFEGNTIAPKDFSRMANTDARFKSALKTAYNAKYAGFVGKAWAAVAGRFKVNKKLPELEAAKDKDAARAKMNQIAKEGTGDAGSRMRVTPSDEDCTSNCISKEEADRINAKADEINDGAKNSAASEVRSKLSGIGTSTAANFFKISAPLDYACQVYGATTALTYGAKAIRSAQLVRYAMIFFSVADAIKGGASPDPADVAVLGEALTTTVVDSADTTKTLVASATDSFGYKYAEYGDAGASEQSLSIANRFMAGGGFVGEMSAATAALMSVIPGGRQGASNTCGVLANPFVQGGSIILGVAALLVPGANVTKAVVSAAAGAAVGITLAVLPGLLMDIVAGTVTDDIVGEEAGNAITSGAGTLMSDALAAQNGNGLMTKEDTLAYNALQTQTVNDYIAYELEGASPFDATNPHTFLGSLSSALMPLRSSSNPLTFVNGLFASSVKNIVPSSSAVTTAQQAAALEVCQDQDAIDAGYAVDPFCNVIRGIPPQYLNKDPVAVVESLIANGDLTASEAPTGQYTDWMNKCITSDGPVGYSNLDAGFNQDEASACVITDSKIADRYLYYMDLRIEAGMNDEDTVDGSAENTQNTGRPPEAIDRGGNGGWTLANNVDYSHYQCDPRTPDAGTYTSSQYGWTIRLCEVDFNTSDFGAGNGGNLVNALISTNAMNMFEAAAADGVSLGLSDGMRRRPPAYFSMHSTGLAMDLGTPIGGATICYGGSTTNGYGSLAAAEAACKRRGGEHYKAYTWLRANSERFGFFNFVNEPWHYSTSGTGI